MGAVGFLRGGKFVEGLKEMRPEGLSNEQLFGTRGFCCNIFDERFWFYEVDPGQVCGLRKVLTIEILHRSPAVVIAYLMKYKQ